MPVHRIPRVTLHEDLLDIERKQGERVMSITPDAEDSTRFIVITEFRGVETREVTA